MSRPPATIRAGFSPGDRRSRPGSDNRQGGPPLTLGERLVLVGLLVATFVLRAWHADQPIVENYVGRQIPTAMVARNLERGSGFLFPELDTGPFPNRFLVEPPIYALAAVALQQATGIALEPAGRLVSALGMVLAGWGLFGLARRREATAAALLAVAALAAMPITLRYGRAFQPDALMLGCAVAGLRCWDEFSAAGYRYWLIPAWLLLATALALKVTSAYLLVPLLAVVLKPASAALKGLALATLLPAGLWYAHVAHLLGDTSASSAFAENATIWLHVLIPAALLRPATYGLAARFLLVRAFTPLGFLLAGLGLARSRAGDRLWTVWGSSAAVALALLAAKLHHEYYFLALVPLAAVGIGRALADLGTCCRGGRVAAIGLGGALLVLSAYQSASTWRTPPQWAKLRQAAALVHEQVPAGEPLIAPEALLYYADRRGYRLEINTQAVSRAAREAGTDPADSVPSHVDPETLVAIYRGWGARYLADLPTSESAASRRALHAAVRHAEGSWRTLIDRPGLLFLAGPGTERPAATLPAEISRSPGHAP